MHLNRIQSSRRLDREAQRNVGLMWLTGRLMPDFKTIARFRKDNGKAIRAVCRQFVMLCRFCRDKSRKVRSPADKKREPYDEGDENATQRRSMTQAK